MSFRRTTLAEAVLSLQRPRRAGARRASAAAAKQPRASNLRLGLDQRKTRAPPSDRSRGSLGGRRSAPVGRLNRAEVDERVAVSCELLVDDAVVTRSTMIGLIAQDALEETGGAVLALAREGAEEERPAPCGHAPHLAPREHGGIVVPVSAANASSASRSWRSAPQTGRSWRSARPRTDNRSTASAAPNLDRQTRAGVAQGPIARATPGRRPRRECRAPGLGARSRGIAEGRFVHAAERSAWRGGSETGPAADLP